MVASKDKTAERDELFADAAAIVREANQASVSMIQRRMRVGYTRAARIIEQLEAAGVIGPYEGDRPRQVFPVEPEAKPKRKRSTNTAAADSEPERGAQRAKTPRKRVAKPKARKKQTRGRKTAWDTLDIPSRLEQIAAWARDGATDRDIAEALGVGHTTFYEWKQNKAEFAAALKVSKEIADQRVVSALYQRAMGYEYTEETRELVRVEDEEGNWIKERDTETGALRWKQELKVVKTVKKQVSPDTTAQIFWLKNRDPARWRDRQHIEHGGLGGGNDYSYLTNGELDAEIARIEALERGEAVE